MKGDSYHPFSLENGHPGQETCWSPEHPEMPRESKSGVWRPGLTKQIEDLIRECPTCIKTKVYQAKAMIPSKLLERPWQKVATDLFDWKGQEFVLVVDYFSR